MKAEISAVEELEIFEKLFDRIRQEALDHRTLARIRDPHRYVVNAKERFSFAPSFLPLSLAFRDGMKWIQEEYESGNIWCNDTLKEVILEHAREDDFHFKFLIQDLKGLFGVTTAAVDDIQPFFYPDQFLRFRIFGYSMVSHVRMAAKRPVILMLVMEAMETTNRVFLEELKAHAESVSKFRNYTIQFFGGPGHLGVEDEHAGLFEFLKKHPEYFDLTRKEIELARTIIEDHAAEVMAFLDSIHEYSNKCVDMDKKGLVHEDRPDRIIESRKAQQQQEQSKAQ